MMEISLLNLYGWAMTHNNTIIINHNNNNHDNTKCCILEVDLQFPEQLHNLHNDYPLIPEKIDVKENTIRLLQKDCN